MIGIPLFSSKSTSPSEHASQGRVQHRISFENTNIIVLIETSDDLGLETGGSIWHAGYNLAQYLIQHPELVRGKRVLEIGCGCGLVGIVAAALGSTSVLLTDLEMQIPIIRRNIYLNQSLFDASRCEVSAASFSFGSTAGTLNNYGLSEVDLVLGADIGYDIELHFPIVQSLQSLLENSGTVIVLAEEIRWKDIYGWYRECLGSSFPNLQVVSRSYSNSIRKTEIDIICISP